MNQIGLVGRLTKDPVVKHFPENRVQANFTIAVNRNFRNHKGDVEADFLFCVAWGKLAEHVAKYCGKGSLIGVNGRLQSRNYERQDNIKVYMTEVVVEAVRFYVLKSTEQDKGAHSSHTLQIAETPDPLLTATQHPDFDIPNEFVLPKEEPNLPIL